jgi:histidinol phosphatase-like PHP family hydrolase
LFSDGVLLPSELVYRAKVKGYTAIAVTDHVDYATYDFVIPRIKKVAAILARCYGIKVIAGVEVTYVPPALIKDMVKKCRSLGAKIVVIHGETPAETVPPGTNHAAVLSGADILAHPGPINEADVRLAAKHHVCLEITTRNGHNATNRHVAQLGLKHKARLVLNTDTHAPENLLDAVKIKKTLLQSGLPKDYYTLMQDNARLLVRNIR